MLKRLNVYLAIYFLFKIQVLCYAFFQPDLPHQLTVTSISTIFAIHLTLTNIEREKK